MIDLSNFHYVVIDFQEDGYSILLGYRQAYSKFHLGHDDLWGSSTVLFNPYISLIIKKSSISSETLFLLPPVISGNR